MVRGTWSCDLDVGRQSGDRDSDFWWEQIDETARRLVPENGAHFLNLGQRDFGSVTYDDLKRMRYSDDWIDGSSQLPVGTVVAALTNEGRYAKFIVTNYGYNLGIRWITYERE